MIRFYFVVWEFDGVLKLSVLNYFLSLDND